MNTREGTEHANPSHNMNQISRVYLLFKKREPDKGQHAYYFHNVYQFTLVEDLLKTSRIVIPSASFMVGVSFNIYPISFRFDIRDRVHIPSQTVN